MMRRKFPVLLLAFIVISFASGCERVMDLIANIKAGTEVGVYPSEKFGSMIELKGAMEEGGYVQVGSFGDSWPARVTEVRKDTDSIQFTRASGTRHNYKGFDGYELVIVRLQAENGEEVLVVFRSKEKM